MHGHSPGKPAAGELLEGMQADGTETEEQKPIQPSMVRTPSQAEQEEHFASGHATYRSWCPHCVAAKGRGNPHVSRPSNPSDLPEIGIDYFFMTQRDVDEGLPHLAAKDRKTGSFAGTTLESKGRNSYALSYLVGWLRGLAYKRVVLRSDNEPSILALLADARAEMTDVELVIKSAPEGDSPQNGLAEVAVREVKGQARVLRSHLETMYKRRLKDNEPVLAWIVRHSANAINRSRIGSDGCTPEQRRVGKKWQRPTVWFGEQVFYKPAPTSSNRPRGGEMKMRRGVYVGHHERTGATLLLTPEGVARGVGITKVPVEDRWDYDFLTSCKGLPWETQPRRREAPTVVSSEGGELLVPVPAEVDEARSKRRRYITVAEIDRYGGTPECVTCTMMAMGARGARPPHSDRCRERFAELWRKDETPAGQAKAEADALRRGEDPAEQQQQPQQMDQSSSSGQTKRDRDEEVEESRDQKSMRGSASSGDSGPGGKRIAEESEGTHIDGDVKVKRVRFEGEGLAVSPARPGLEGSSSRSLSGQAQGASQGGLAVSPARPGGQGSQGSQGGLAVSPARPDLEGSPLRSGKRGREGEDEAMSLGKLELLPAVERKIRDSFEKEGVAITDDEVKDIGSLCLAMSAVDVAEIYTPPRFTPVASRYGLTPGFCVDLTTEKPSGGHWDLSRTEDVRELEQLQEREKPRLLIGSPPCKDFCRLLLFRISKEEMAERQEQGGKQHIRTAVDAYWRQLREGRHFLHEHPARSDSWKMPEIVEMSKDPRVHIVQGPMCRWKMALCDSQGTGFVRKETKWMTSSPELAKVLQGTCSNYKGRDWHRHIHLEGGSRTAPSAQYPPGLVCAVLRSFRTQLLEDGQELHSFAAGPHNDEAELPGGKWDSSTEVPYFVDSVSGQQLDPAQVKAGRAEEMSWIDARKVFIPVPIEECWEHQGKPYDMKWVDVKKDKKVRCRLVVREIKARKRKDGTSLDPATVFAAMPPVEGVKALISHLQTEQRNSKGEPLEMLVLDVSRAHFYGASRRKVYTTLPEGYEEEGKCALLLRTMYGTEDAAHIWLDTWNDHLRAGGYQLGRSNPSLYSGQDLRGLCHGDDFITVGSRSDLLAFEAHLAKGFDIRRTGHLGFAADCDGEISVLRRAIRVNRDIGTIELEADRRHVSSLLDTFGLKRGKSAVTPRIKVTDGELAKIAASPVLEGIEATKFRSATMRAAYLAVDRPDISETVKALSQAMASPREGHMALVKRLVRYLAGVPRRAIVYPRQDPADAHIEVKVDSDWAGDKQKRRSTSGMVLLRGRHLLRHSSTLQTSISLSSGEAEYYAMVRGSCYGLGLQSNYSDWQLDLKLRVYSDSSAARSLAKRRGLGKQRHVQTHFLWLQDRVRMGHLEIRCIKGKVNPADLFTKALPRSDMDRHCRELGLEVRGKEGEIQETSGDTEEADTEVEGLR